jgi:hypothetical protein
MVFGLGATVAYSIETVVNSHSSGPMPTAGPRQSMGFGGPGGHGGPGFARPDEAALGELMTGLGNRWAAASVGSMMVSDLELKTGASLMAIGGFMGGDNSPTLAQFQQYVANGDVRYFFDRPAGDRGGPRHDPNGSAREITEWVKAHYTPQDIGGITVYDLQHPRA